MESIRILGTGSFAPPKLVTNDDMALPAAMNALEAAKMTAKDLELIIVATVTPDTHYPAAANDISIDKIVWLIPHQANIRMFQNISQFMNIPIGRFYLTLQKYRLVHSGVRHTLHPPLNHQ